MQYKTCTKCGEEKPLTSEYFGKRSKSKDGYRSECKCCRKKYSEDNKEQIAERNRQRYIENKDVYSEKSKAYYNENKTKIKAWQKQYAIDNKGKIKKYREENKEYISQKQKEYRIKNKESVLQTLQNWRDTNKQHIQQYSIEYYQKNKEWLSEKQKVYRQENKEYVAERMRKWRVNNKEHEKQYREENKDYIKKRNTEWRKSNMHLNRQTCQRYRARKKQLPNTLTIKQWENIKKDFNNSCAYCGMTEKEHIEIYGQQLHQEHFIALSEGGEYTHNNIIPACISCNSSKGNKDFFEWYPQQPYYSKERERKILDFLGYQQGTQQLTIAL